MLLDVHIHDSCFYYGPLYVVIVNETVLTG